MKCPFRVGAEFVYTEIIDDKGRPDYLQKEQRAVYPDCYEHDCPFYNYAGGCDRIGDDR